jgi:hypothetical protein
MTIQMGRQRRPPKYSAGVIALRPPAIASADLILAGTFTSLTLAGNQVLTQVGPAEKTLDAKCRIRLAFTPIRK